MTISPLSVFPPRNITEARVVSRSIHTTALGDRIYVVFSTADGATLGFWSSADHPTLKTLHVGDATALKRHPNGYLTLVSQSTSSINPLGIFLSLLNKKVR